MSLRQEMLKEIKAMLNEVEDGQPLPPEQQSTSECPAGMIKAGSGSNDGTKPICRYPTEQEKAGMEMGKKAGKFIGDMTDKARQGIQQGIQGGLDWLKGYQSKGVCPPGMEQTGEGPSGPLCSPKATAKVAKKAVRRGLFDIGSKGPKVKELQTILATQGYDDEFRGNKAGQLTYDELSKIADGIYGKRTAAAVKLFQKDNGMPQTGFVDQVTYDALTKLGRGKNIVGATQPSGPDVSPKGPSGVGASGAGAPVPFEESKNWANRTREKSSANLFERLVKDAAKSKVL